MFLYSCQPFGCGLKGQLRCFVLLFVLFSGIGSKNPIGFAGEGVFRRQ
ncbi:hypothetical protein HMPREF0281_02345 [Corynebacterium ammoniagenes DSM 20306]|uniref:Uncharacterized protein n=1 Tax=Corynebacterium ammoniagenes DSM 20306 TaxID=649754 RepID=A0ABP2I9R5_CORAM|nr:hypothetical protein HMPREF0281_02345 [Corynebacterium ammoniagenes DSM 20306]